MENQNLQKDLMSGKALKRNFYNHRDAGNAFIYSILSLYIVAFAVILITMVVFDSNGLNTEDISNNLAYNIISALISPICFISFFFIFNKISKTKISSAKIKFNLKWHTVLLLVGISFLCVFGLQYFITGIDMGLEAIGYKLTETNIPLNTVGWYFFNIFALALLPAIGEELLFRGIIFNGLRRNMKDITAMLISATLFTLMHGSLEQFVYPFILGIILSWIVLRTGSIVSSMIIHFTNNALVVTLSFITTMTGFSFYPSQTWLFWTIAVVLMAITFVGIFLIDKFYFKKKNKDEIEKNFDINQEGKFPSISLILGIILSVLIFITNIASSF